MKTKFFSKWLWRLASLAVVLATLIGSVETAYAIPPEPIDEDTGDIGEVPDKFTWNMLPRFGNDTDGDGVTNYIYDPAFVNAATFTVKFKGCPPLGTGIGNQYAWEIDGTPLPTMSCMFSYDLTSGRHHVKFTATPPTGLEHVYEEDILVRDILIVSLGDSIASGEGNPDIPQFSGFASGILAPARWVDRRCHRSAYAGPAQAALAIERADPHTSVTFVSLACSGATLSHVGYYPYMGIEPGPGDTELPPQLDALLPIIGQRHIDALMVSGGANDLVFGGIIENCIEQSACHTLGSILSDVERKLQNVLPGHYAGLTNKIAQWSDGPGGESGLNVANVYFTEYPNLVRDADGDVCDSIMGEILPPLSINKEEATWAETAVFQPLNATMRQAVDNATASFPFIGWHYVDGIDEAFAGPGFGHGYCAGDESWIRTVHVSACMQGPLLPTTTCGFIPPWELTQTRGVMHPTVRGHQEYRDQLLAFLLPDLFPDQPLPGGPSFSTNGSSGSTSNRLGANGWIIGSCDGAACASDRAVLKVVATDTAEIHGTSVAVDGKAGCDASTVPGVACTPLALDSQRDGWQFSIAAEGIHRLEFAALNGDEQVSTFAYELKVDLTDPTATATITDAVPSAAGWYNVPVSVTLSGIDAAGLGQGSGVYLVEYNLDGVAGEVSPGSTVTVTGDGIHTLTYQSVDLAGRRSPMQSLTVWVDTTPPAVNCAAPDGLWHASDVSLACTASDSASGLANTVDAAFTLTTSLADGTETADALTGTRSVCDLAGNCATAGPIGGNLVDKKAPSITVTAPASTTYVLNQVVAASYTCVDGGSGVASCAGPVANGSPLDTATLGAHTFVVDAADNMSHTASQSVSYTVAYNICALYDQTRAHRSGNTVPIKLQLCDAAGANHSAAAIVVNATGLTQQDGTASDGVEDSGNANPDDNFRYDEELEGYIFNLSTDGLTTGTWVLSFTVTGDPIPHTVQFDVR